MSPKPGSAPRRRLRSGAVGGLGPDPLGAAAVLLDDHRAEVAGARRHRAGEAVDRGLLAEHALELGRVGRRDPPRVERAEPPLQLERPRERLLHRDLLVEREADQQRDGVAGEQRVRLVVGREVEAVVGHARCYSEAYAKSVANAQLPGERPTRTARRRRRTRRRRARCRSARSRRSRRRRADRSRPASSRVARPRRRPAAGSRARPARARSGSGERRRACSPCGSTAAGARAARRAARGTGPRAPAAAARRRARRRGGRSSTASPARRRRRRSRARRAGRRRRRRRSGPPRSAS